jgi:hypothetical protein
LKQWFEIVSIDDGMQIDLSDVQFPNADSPRLLIRQSEAKITDKIEKQRRKHPFEIDSISRSILTSDSFPKYRIAFGSLKSNKNPPETRKNRFSAATVTLRIPEPSSAKAVISRSVAGRQIDWSNPQPSKAPGPTVES